MEGCGFESYMKASVAEISVYCLNKIILADTIILFGHSDVWSAPY